MASAVAPNLVPDVPEGIWSTLGRLTGRILQAGPAGEDPRLRREFRRRAMHTLLKGSPRPCLPPLSVPDSLRAEAFDRRLRGGRGRAERLEALAQKVSEMAETDREALAPMVALLLALKSDDQGDYDPPPDQDEDERARIFPFRLLLTSSTLPNRTVEPGPFLIGEFKETAAVRPYRQFSFRDFSDSAFPKHPTDKVSGSTEHGSYKLLDMDIFKRTPGTGLTFLSAGEAVIEKSAKLGIPDLDLLCGDGAGRDLRLPLLRRSKDDDEGYESPVRKTPDLAKEDSSEKAKDLWDLARELELPPRRTWECLGRIDPVSERPYLSEVGSEGVHLAWVAAMRNLKLVDSRTFVPELRQLDEDTFVTHLGYLMIGIASETFAFDEKEEKFRFSVGTCVPGVTTDTLRSFSQEFMTCGTYCRRLEKLCEARPKREKRLLGYTKPGLIYLSFLDGVSKYLQGYRTTVLNIARKKHILDVSVSLSKLSCQMQFLGRLCKVHLDGKTKSGRVLVEDELPTGIQLLCYLFDRTLHINTRDLYFVLVAILRRTAEPYFRFLERWIFRGVHHDDFSEFGLHSNPQCFSARTRLYWSSAYTVADPSATSSFLLDGSVCGGGSFLGEIQQQVYVCGKTVNLLRLCQPRHHLCAAMVERQPVIKLLVSPIEQADLKDDCQGYVAYVSRVAEEKSRTLKQVKEKQEEERKEVLRRVHQKRKENLERIRQEKRQAVQEAERRKKKVYDDLKEQVLAERKRKEEERKRRQEEDLKYAEMSRKKDEEEVRREERVRREMEEHYKRLSEEAEGREARARWRTQRLELRGARLAFWRKENKKIQDELRKRPMEDLSSVAEESTVSSPSPKWKSVRVQEDEMRNVVLVLEDEEGNIVAEGVAADLAGCQTLMTGGMRDRLLGQGFQSLPGWARTKLVEGLLEKKDEKDKIATTTIDVADGGSGRRRSSGDEISLLSSTKRKRPESFVESDLKRVEIDKGVMAPPASASAYWQIRKSRSNLTLSEWESSESLAAALDSAREQQEVVRRRRRPRDLKMIEGRKRPVSAKSIEEVLYPARFSQHGPGSASEAETPVTPAKTEFKLLPSLPVRPYSKSFEGIGAPEVENIAAMLRRRQGDEAATTHGGGERGPDRQAFAPLSLLMENSILIPLRAQLRVANAAMLNCLLVDSGLMAHFTALRNYLLFHDGEFAHQLSSSLFSEIRGAQSPLDVVNPSTLNRIVENAVLTSTFGSRDPLASNVGFLLRNPREDEDDGEGNGSDVSPSALTLSNAFDYLRLGYRTEWPCNIVLTEDAVASYGRIFAFLLQLRKAVWGLEQVFMDLKEMRGCETSPQYRRAHLMRHEMLNFITSTQDYVTTQVLDVSWSEFESELEDGEKVFSVDTLYEAHERYLKKALFRCILNRKARPVHKIILDLFNIVAEFSLLLTSAPWDVAIDGLIVHPNMDKVEDCYRHFREYSGFLYTVVKKLAARGYQHHLYDLLLSLNFNGFYEKSAGGEERTNNASTNRK